MAVVVSDIVLRYSGGAANSDPAASLGGVISANGPTSGVLNNLFDDVAPAESLAGDTEYRCVYVVNTNGADTLSGVTVWFNGDSPAAGSTMGIGLDPAGVNGQAVTVANENTAPAGVTFSAAVTIPQALAIGDLGPGEYQAVWIRRAIAAGAESYPNDGVTLMVRGTPV